MEGIRTAFQDNSLETSLYKLYKMYGHIDIMGALRLGKNLHGMQNRSIRPRKQPKNGLN